MKMIRKIKYAFMLLLALAQGVDSMADVVLTVKTADKSSDLRWLNSMPTKYGKLSE